MGSYLVRRLLLMAAEGVTCLRPTGEVQLAGNRYWADELVDFMGDKVTVRFDPDDLHAPVSVYDAKDGRFICEAPAIVASAAAHDPGVRADDPVSVLAALRAWKNSFQ